MKTASERERARVSCEVRAAPLGMPYISPSLSLFLSFSVPYVTRVSQSVDRDALVLSHGHLVPLATLLNDRTSIHCASESCLWLRRTDLSLERTMVNFPHPRFSAFLAPLRSKAFLNLTWEEPKHGVP